uniref:Uncharacterized protein n=1 Tax=Arundo donax TaxID=35708 RepID=A0A0A8YUN1_ARUDO
MQITNLLIAAQIQSDRSQTCAGLISIVSDMN